MFRCLGCCYAPFCTQSTEVWSVLTSDNWAALLARREDSLVVLSECLAAKQTKVLKSYRKYGIIEIN